MATTLQQVKKAMGTDKFVVLAAAVDHVIEAQGSIQEKVSLDDQIETLDMLDLASKYSVSLDTLRKQITQVLGENAIFRLGKHWVIRKRKFLEYLKAKESGKYE